VVQRHEKRGSNRKEKREKCSRDKTDTQTEAEPKDRLNLADLGAAERAGACEVLCASQGKILVLYWEDTLRSVLNNIKLLKIQSSVV
jgi:hypothetical protein